ncbi:hypothetical protein E1B28_013710 [Marasmius oreades]|uniref:Uncharacterized protein n=1 Tax=Marasmius oreades TaxID=181124 RepID=A0A9P7UQ62_9AGAR|nr:uncharacterized protein E1B28_013710 [Marasmius oreades]KAG7087769.1 hypothetical protein E1B28_013710 [Marasmius oreades]
MSRYHYILLSLYPPFPPNSELKIRQSIQEALIQSFGVALGSTYVDIISIKDDGSEAVLRADVGDAKPIMASLAAYTSSMRVVKDTAFLPALLATRVRF